MGSGRYGAGSEKSRCEGNADAVEKPGGNKNTSGNKNTGSTNTNIGGNNKPTSTTGNLDTTKTTGRIPQTGDVSIVDIILVAGCMLLIPTGIVTFKRYRKISK